MGRTKDIAEVDVILNNDTARKKLQDMVADFDALRRKKVEALKAGNGELAKSLEKEMSVIKKELNQMQKQTVDVDNVLRNLNKVPLSQLQDASRKLRKDLQGMDRDSVKYLETRRKLLKIEKELSESSGKKSGFSLGSGMMSVFGGNILTSAASAIKGLLVQGKEWINQGIEMAAKAEGVTTAFKKLNSPDLLKNLRRETKGTVNDLALMQAAVKAENFKIPLDKLGSLLKFAQQRAQETGESVDYLTNSIINGIGRKSPLILDNLGISAATLRTEMQKTGDFTAAALKIVGEELDKQGTLALTSADKGQQAAVKWENAQLAVGNVFKKVGNLWHTISGNIADAIVDVTNHMRSSNEVYNEQIAKVAELQANVIPLADEYVKLKGKIELTADENVRLNTIIQTIAGNIPGVITEFDKYGDALDINIDKVYAYIDAERARLQYMNRDAIVETKKYIKKNQEQFDRLNTDYAREGRMIAQSRGMGPSEAVFVPYTDKEKREIEQNIKDTSTKLLGAQEQLKQLNGSTVEDQLQTQQKQIKQRAEFNNMNKVQLDAWIKDENNAGNEYLALAKQIYAQRFKEDSGGKTKKVGKWSLEKDQKFMQQKIELRKQLQAGEIATEEEYNRRLLDLEIEAYQLRIDSRRESGEDMLKLQSDLADKQYQKAKNEQSRLDKLMSASLEGARADDSEQRYAREKVDYEKRLKDLGLFNRERESMTELELSALLNLERIHTNNLQKIYVDRIAKQAEAESKELQRSLNAMKIEHKQEFDEADTFAKKKALLFQYYSAEEAAAVRTSRQADKLLKNHYQKVEQDDVQQHLKGLLVKYQKMLAEINDVTDNGVSLGMLDPEEVERIQAIIDKLNQQLAELRGTGGGVDLEGPKVDVLGFSMKDWQQLFDNLASGEMGLQGWQTALGAIGNAFSDIFKLVNTLEKREFKNFEKTQNRKKDKLQKDREQQIISQDAYNAAIQAIDAETDAKRAEMERKQAAREKALATFQAIVNTAVAVTAALGSKPFGPWNIALAAAVGALGAVQVGSILATPTGYEDGGPIDVTRAQDGRRFRARKDPDRRGAISSPTVLVAENGTEYVVPNEGYENPTIRPVLDIIERARRNGTLDTINLPELIRTSSTGRSRGGYADPDRGPDPVAGGYPDDPELKQLLRAILATNDKLNGKLDKPFRGVVSMTGRGGIIEAQDRYDRYHKNVNINK